MDLLLDGRVSMDLVGDAEAQGFAARSPPEHVHPRFHQHRTPGQVNLKSVQDFRIQG